MKKILIVEDDQIVSSVYRSLLESRGFKVEIASDGQSGYYKMTEAQPDAVLLDIMLPKMNGVEILRKIRAQRSFQTIPVLVFTNAYVPNMVDTALQAGANFVFSKSTLTPQQLIDALQHCLSTDDSALPASASMQANVQLMSPAVALPTAPATPPPSWMTPTPPTSDSGLLDNSAPFYNAPSAPIPQPAGSFQPGVYGSTPPTNVVHSTNFKTGAETPAAQTEDDLKIQRELKVEFMKSVDGGVSKMRQSLGELNRVNSDAARADSLDVLFRQIRSIGSNASLAGYRPVGDLCSALEALLAELVEKPKNLNPSIQRTLGNTVDIITQLLVRRVEENILETQPPAILVVDDEVLSRRAVTFALDKGRLKSTSIEKPEEALRLASTQRFDLIFLDVQMPGLNGFDLCTQIRAKAVNQHTPVIFVTSMSDFKSRARSTMSGATDLIAKPFMFIELTVKAIAALLHNRVLKPQQGVSSTRRAA